MELFAKIFCTALIGLQIAAALIFIVTCLTHDYRRKKAETQNYRQRERARRDRLGDAYRNGFACGELLAGLVVVWCVLALLWITTH